MRENKTGLDKLVWIIFSIIIFFFAVFSIGLAPFFYQGIGLSHILVSLTFTSVAVSVFWIKGISYKKNNFWLLILLFFSNYFFLIIGLQIFELILRIRLATFEEISISHISDMTENWSKLMRIYTNDLGRNLLYFFGIFYSLIVAIIFFILIKCATSFRNRPKVSRDTTRGA